MLEKWTGDLVGKMHTYRVTFDDVAKEIGVTKAYISMILNGNRTPANAQTRLEAAVDAIISRRTAANVYDQKGDVEDG